MTKISGLVITYNEAQHIRACLESLLQVCDEVIVVDSLSTDDTVAIATAMGVKVVSQAFLGYGLQKNHGLAFCQHAWVLSLDADERLDADAIADIQRLDLANSQYDTYEFFAVKTCFMVNGYAVRRGIPIMYGAYLTVKKYAFRMRSVTKKWKVPRILNWIRTLSITRLPTTTTCSTS